MISQWIFYALGAYLLGSIPFGKLIARKVAHIDITTRGSRNIGATNVARELGLKWGVLTLLLDVLKGLAPVAYLAFRGEALGPNHETGISLVALSALVGHQFSLFERFRGGKGVATALGVFLGISPLSCLPALLLFVLTIYKWDFVSLGSMVAAASMPLWFALFGQPSIIVLGSLVAAVLICLKHRENIQRLLKGEERKWSKRHFTPAG